MSARIPAALIGALILTCAPSLRAQQAEKAAAPNIPQLVKQAREAYAEQDYAAYLDAVSQMHELRPNNSDYMAQVVIAQALLGNKSAAYNQMLTMQRQGLSYDFSQLPQTEAIRGTEAFDYINDLMVRQGQPLGEATMLFELPADLVLTSSVAWDPGRKALLVGAAREGTVHAVSMDGEVTELLHASPENGLWGVYGLLVDAARDRLWITSSAGAVTAGIDEADRGKTALFEFELRSLKRIAVYEVPSDGRPHRLGAIAGTPGGDLYVTDTVLPIIYRYSADEGRLQPFVASGGLVSLRGIAVSQDGRLLYVADYEMGIMALDLDAHQVHMLKMPDNFNAGGIEGLVFWNGNLVIIQNGIRPQRVMRLTLSQDGLAVENFAPLAVAQPFFDYPNFGTMVGDDLVFLANSHWVRKPQGMPEPVRVARTNVAKAPDVISPDLDKFWDDYEKSTGNKRPD